MTGVIDLGSIASCLRCGRIILATQGGGLLNPPARLRTRIGAAVGFDAHLRQGLGFGVGWHSCQPDEAVGLRYIQLMPLKGHA